MAEVWENKKLRRTEPNMVGDKGVEPLTSSTSMKRSSQLS